jgi:hypothetical protein
VNILDIIYTSLRLNNVSLLRLASSRFLASKIGQAYAEMANVNDTDGEPMPAQKAAAPSGIPGAIAGEQDDRALGSSQFEPKKAPDLVVQSEEIGAPFSSNGAHPFRFNRSTTPNHAARAPEERNLRRGAAVIRGTEKSKSFSD